MTQMLFHLFTRKRGKEPDQQDQEKKSLNWFLFFWLGFIYALYMLPRVMALFPTEDDKPVCEQSCRAIIMTIFFV